MAQESGRVLQGHLLLKVISCTR